MTADQLVQDHVKAFNNHDARTWASHYSADAVVVDPQYPEPLRGRAAIQKDVEDFIAAFPDMKFTLISTLVAGNRIAIEGTGEGTHSGPLETPGGPIPATSRRATLPFVAMVRLDASGSITEERRYYDLAGLRQQLGLSAASA